ncbi:DnaJ domain-containing protein [Nocardioides sp. C4-1]|uniref:J domain-containing protein n=1 Tax=Nocardioides sp. C4-1 TaxID=3151851 RepID=UPI003267DE9D
MIPSWYDVLGVEQDATDAEIRSAWKASVADLEPSDRRFKQRNRAAEVLLDPDRRAAHDAELAAAEDDGDDADDRVADDVVAEPPTAVTLAKETPADDSDEPDDETAGPAGGVAASSAASSADGRPSRGPARLAACLAVLAAVLVVATAVSLVTGVGGDDDDGGGLPDAREVAAAQAAAEAAIGPVLSYDFRDLEEGFAAARPYLTDRFATEFDEFSEVVADNATRTKSIVTTDVLASGVVRTGEDRVDVLVFVDRPTKNAGKDTVYRDQVTLRMVDDDDRWLVDCLITQPGGTCD